MIVPVVCEEVWGSVTDEKAMTFVLQGQKGEWIETGRELGIAI